jgi:antigen flippase
MNNYRSILKTSGLVGMVQIIRMVFGLIRNKMIAVILGANGFGIWGLYQSYVEMVSTFASLGIDKSGVREIAINSHNEKDLKSTVFAIHTLQFFIAVIAFSIFSYFSKIISVYLFDTSDYKNGIIIASFASLLTCFGNSNVAILNGIRDLKGLALSQIISSIIGTVIIVSIMSLLDTKGIPYFFLISSTIYALTSVIFLIRNKLIDYRASINQLLKSAKFLITIGLGFSGSALVLTVSSFMINSYISKEFDLGSVGIYQASWTISNLYIGIILSAIGIDFMPRITKTIEDNIQAKKLLNEQMEFGLLISSLGILFILMFSKQILIFLYSKEFIMGTSIIRWQVLGVVLRVLGFPFGYALMAKNKPLLFFIIQLIFACLNYIFVILFTQIFGFKGLGMNYFFAYLIYTLIIYLTCYRIIGYQPSNFLLRLILFISILVILVFFLPSLIDGTLLITVKILIFAALIYIVNKILIKQMGISVIDMVLKKLKKNE